MMSLSRLSESAMTKQFLGGVALIAVLATPAVAADLSLKAPPRPAFNWSGCYLGANGGWKSGRFVDTVVTSGGSALIPRIGLIPFPPGAVDMDPATTSSGAVGGQVGCRWENGEHWVFGLEGDLDWTGLDAVVTSTSPPTTGIFPGDTFENRARWEGSGRIIFGRTLDRWFVYGTGGFAVSRVTMSANFIATTIGGVAFPASSGSDSQILTGGTLGFGVTYALTSNWEIGAEYRYTYYQPKNFNLGTATAVCLGAPPVCASTAATGHKGLDTNEVLARINYRFGWPDALPARY
jgi:outer membrane immunogenic protein